MGGSLTLMIIVWIQKNDGLSDDLNVIVTARGRNGVFTVQLLCNYYGGVPSVKERKARSQFISGGPRGAWRWKREDV